jgi:hypothetical protein
MIELPDWAVPNSASPTYVDFGGLLTPGLGGRVQRIDRMGNRFRVSVGFPPMVSKDRGRILVSRLLRAKSEGLRLEFPLLGFKPGSPGAPKVNGAGQSGRTLIADGFTPNYIIREGQWFSLEEDGQHYLHNVDAEVVANASGQATLTISPMLRVEPSDNAVLHFSKPMLEGYVRGEEWQWQMSLSHHLTLEAEIEERA